MSSPPPPDLLAAVDSSMIFQEGTIPEETFRKAQVTTLDEALAAANRIGYPVMVKASEGGGGKGIRMSHSDEDMRSHFVQVNNGYFSGSYCLS